MAKYEVAEHQGCDLGDRCPNGPDAVQVYVLDAKGRRRFNLTQCVKASEVEAQRLTRQW
jgi:hypothetical protein